MPGSLRADSSTCVQAVERLHALFSEHLPQNKQELENIRQVLKGEQFSGFRLLELSLENRGNEILKLCRKHELSEQLLVFFAVYLARPFRSWIAHKLAETVDHSAWSAGYCPVCGHWPSMSCINDNEDGKRSLWCLQCGTWWNFPRLKCAHCNNEDQQKLHLLHPEKTSAYRTQCCEICKRYMKEFRSTQSVDELPFDAVYLGSTALDMLAMEAGYIRESPLVARTEGLEPTTD